MYDGVDAAVMEINAAAMFLVRALPLDIAFEDEVVTAPPVEMDEVARWSAGGRWMIVWR